MNLCRIETADCENPGFIDPALVGCVKRAIVGSALGTFIYERGLAEPRCLTSKLSTRDVVALLEAHEAKQNAASKDILIAEVERTGILNTPAGLRTCLEFAKKFAQRIATTDAGEPTDREAILIDGLRRIANVTDKTDDLGTWQFAEKVLRDAGVPVAEPEPSQ